QWMPYRLRGRDWDRERDALGDLVVRTLAEYAPDLMGTIVARDVLTPLDLERRYGLTGGQIFHGEHALDQLYAMRPVLGWAQNAIARPPTPWLSGGDPCSRSPDRTARGHSAGPASD